MLIPPGRFFVCLLPFGLITLIGCASPVGNVSGTVKYNGAAVEHGTVSFVSQRHATVHTGKINPDGTYEIKGVPYGPAIVTVIQLPKDALSPAEFRKKQIAAGKKLEEFQVPESQSLLPAKYLKADGNNPLTFEINAHQASFDLKLED
jgi:hypothetical protein